MPMSAMKAAFKLPSAARFIKKEGRDDFRTPFFNGKEGFCPLTGEPKGV